MEENLYRPSNGSEGMSFMAAHCENCAFENPDHDYKPKCNIMTLSMVLDITDPEYPKEWCYVNDKPTCTKFKKWDWANGEPPEDLFKEPDPDQLSLF